MPNFPRYNSKATLTSQTPSAPAPQDNTGKAIAQAGQQLGGAVMEVGLKWNQAVDTIQKTTAMNNFKTGMLDIEQRAQKDPNYNNSEQYYREIEKLKTDNLKGFSNKQVEMEMAAEFNYHGKVGQIGIENLYKKKMIDVGQAGAFRSLDILIDDPSTTPEMIKENINNWVAAGLFDHKDAGTIYNKTIKNMGEIEVANDPSTEESQSTILAELRKGKNGKYAETPPDERIALIKASQQRIFNNNQTLKRDTQDASNERSNSLIEKLASNEATLKDIQNELSIPEESGGIKRTQLLIYQRALTAGIKNDLNRMLQEKTPDGQNSTQRAKLVKQYNDLIDNFIDDNTDQWKAKEMLAQAFEDGIVSPKEHQLLNGLKQNLKDIEFNRNTGPVVSAIKGIKDFFHFQSNATDEDIARNIKGLFGEIQKGTDPGHALRMILQKEYLSKMPDYPTYPDTGKLKRDANGNVIRVFPDGTFEDETPKKGK